MQSRSSYSSETCRTGAVLAALEEALESGDQGQFRGFTVTTTHNNPLGHESIFWRVKSSHQLGFQSLRFKICHHADMI